MQKGAMIFLSVVAAALMIVPLIFATMLSVMCMNPTGGSCRTVTAQDWFAGELAGIWMPPFALGLVLIGVVAWLGRRSR